MKLRPNIFLSVLVILSSISLGLLGTGGILLSFFIFQDGSLGLGAFTVILSLSLFILIYLMWRSFKDKVQFVSLDNNTMRIYKPLINETIEVGIDNIKGYSKSLDDRYYGGPIRLNKNLLTIYFNNQFEPVELVQYQIARVKEFEVELNRRKIELLGTEKVQRDIWGRRTRFEYE